MSHYAVYLPQQHGEEEEGCSNVFDNKDKALTMLKSHKGARLKLFQNSKDAYLFSKFGIIAVNDTTTDSIDNNLNGNNNSGQTVSSPSNSAAALNIEKSPFRAPKSQDLVQFRKLIEQGNYDQVKETIWNNPRYLVGSGDTPAILKESTRYNALHVAALAKNSKMCELILQTIGKPYFIQLLHGKDDPDINQEVSNILLDLYLNTPERGRGETPLHLALKYGAVDVVESLTLYPQCQMLANAEGISPKELICSRMRSPNKEIVDQINDLLEERFFVPVIRSIDNSIPPIIGEPFSPTNPPVFTTDPLSPDMEIQAYAGPMNKEQAQTFRKRWKTPPRIFTSPNASPMQMRKLTPQRLFDDKQQQKHTSTPISSAHKGYRNLSPNKSIELQFPLSRNNNLNNYNNQLEFNNHNNYNNQLEFNLIESPFLINEKLDTGNDTNLNENNNNINNDFINKLKLSKEAFTTYRTQRFASEVDSPSSIESPIFSKKYIYNNKSFDDTFDSSIKPSVFDASYHERHLKLIDPQKGLEIIGRTLAKNQNYGWKEYWNFLDCFIDIASTQGLTSFEQYLKKKLETHNSKPIQRLIGNNNINKINKNINNNYNRLQSNNKYDTTFVNNLCNALDKLQLNENALQIVDNNEHKELHHRQQQQLNKNYGNFHQYQQQIDIPLLSSPISSSAYLCIEKSCQVFAKRMTKTFIQNCQNLIVRVHEVHDTLDSELKRLISLICSYKEDLRFLTINFQLVHSRFANLIVGYLNDEGVLNDERLNKIRNCLEEIIQARQRQLINNFHSNNNNNNNINNNNFNNNNNNNNINNNNNNNNNNNDKSMDNSQQSITTTQLVCLLEFLLNYLDKNDSIISPDVLTTENDCSNIWLMERMCNCKWTTEISKQNRNIKRNAKRLEMSDNRKYPTDSPPFGDSSDDENNDEDDTFFSQPDSDIDDGYDDIFYTPVDSPTMFDFLDITDENIDNHYNNYILGEEPTKTDVDVLNALNLIVIDKDVYPNIVQWQTAILKHSADEIERFPSPSVVVNRKQLCSNELIGKRLFNTPTKNNNNIDAAAQLI